MSTSNRRAREKEFRETMILDAAEEIFFSKGFENSTMNDVAHCAELSKGTLYNYFKNKNELCIGIVSKSLQLLIKYIENSISENNKGLENITQTFKAFYDFQQENPKYYCALQSYRQHSCGCGKNSKFLNQAFSENNKINDIFSQMIFEGIADRSIDKSLSPEKTAAVLWGDANGLIPGFDLNTNSIETYEYASKIIINGMKNK